MATPWRGVARAAVGDESMSRVDTIKKVVLPFIMGGSLLSKKKP
jgi:hypothetical protein